MDFLVPKLSATMESATVLRWLKEAGQKVRMAEPPVTRVTLLARIRDGRDADAWREFVQIYGPVVYRFARNRGLQDADPTEHEPLYAALKELPEKQRLAVAYHHLGGLSHREVAEAYIRGLERLVESGGDPSKVASVASFFVSRVDTEADKRLDEVGGHDELKGTLAIANAKLAYQAWKEVFSGPRWERLQRAGEVAEVVLDLPAVGIEPVAEDRQPERAQVQPQLVRAPGPRAQSITARTNRLHHRFGVRLTWLLVRL